MKVDLSTYNNSWYKPGSVIKRVCWYLVNEIVFKTGFFPFYALKIFLLKLFGAKVGRGIFIKPCVNIKYPWLLHLENNIWIGEKVWIDNLALLTIGNNVCISQGAFLFCGNHDFSKPAFDLTVKPIVLEEGVWIGAGAMVCGGVICRSHSMLSAASFAASDLEAYTIYRGNPAEKIKERIIT